MPSCRKLSTTQLSTNSNKRQIATPTKPPDNRSYPLPAGIVRRVDRGATDDKSYPLQFLRCARGRETIGSLGEDRLQARRRRQDQHVGADQVRSSQDSQYWSAAPRDLCLIGDVVLGRWGSVMNDARDRRHPVDRIRFFTIAEVAERLQVAPRTVRRWIKVGDLIVHRVGGVVRIAEGDLRAFLALHREG